MGNCSLLTTQALQQIFLTGELPSELSGSSYLEDLTWNQNQLSGTVPANLSNCSKLQTLDLGGNSFSGTIRVREHFQNGTFQASSCTFGFGFPKLLSISRRLPR
jgi:hypothetical protein